MVLLKKNKKIKTETNNMTEKYLVTKAKIHKEGWHDGSEYGGVAHSSSSRFVIVGGEDEMTMVYDDEH